MLIFRQLGTNGSTRIIAEETDGGITFDGNIRNVARQIVVNGDHDPIIEEIAQREHNRPGSILFGNIEGISFEGLDRDAGEELIEALVRSFQEEHEIFQNEVESEY